jgi:hypothetical protein
MIFDSMPYKDADNFWNAYLPIILNSTLRFCDLPSAVLLVAMGCDNPYPLYSRRVVSTPRLTR